MKASYYKIESPPEGSFRCLRVSEPNLGTPWHLHPEYQLTLIVSGHGHRLVGDNFALLAPHDLTLLGPNLPHFWETDAMWGRRKSATDAIMVHFRRDFLGPDFFSRPELEEVSGLLDRCELGLHFDGPGLRRLTARIEGLTKLHGLDALLELLGILAALARFPGATTISTPGFLPHFSVKDMERIDRVCSHIHANLDSEISREALAKMIHLSPRTFSRYFRQKLGKTLPKFINELRIGRACHLLLKGELSVSQVAGSCGFDNLSHFNEQFKKLKGLTPSEFRSDNTARSSAATQKPERAP